ncbi:MAG: DUF1549 domain-containing protein [Pirellulales bacterium]
MNALLRSVSSIRVILLMTGLTVHAAVAFGNNASTVDSPQTAVSFVNDVVPLLTKSGCNSGACHAKSVTGQNGFRLSLLGFEPEQDHEHIVFEARGRRICIPAPDESLLLQKASGQISHGGGVRFSTDSDEYQLIRKWIADGAPSRPLTDCTITGLSVNPVEQRVAMGDVFNITVTARYSDGSTRDVTQLALYESNDPARVNVNASGVVHVQQLAGRAAIMVRYQGFVKASLLSIPNGPNVTVPQPLNLIDNNVFKNLSSLGVPLSPKCDDATFLRRVTLDITGALPDANDVTSFLTDHSSDKREKLVDSLLASTSYADFFANKWTSVLKNRRDDATDIVPNFAFHAWIRDGLLENKPYDQFVRELLGATGDVVSNPPVAWYKRVTDPKVQVEDISQLFLGVRLQCAQCHNHPFDQWSQDDYYGMVAFFSQVGRTFSGVRGQDLIFHKRGQASYVNPQSGKSIPPSALGADVGPIQADDDPRLILADWMIAPDNPYFAAVLVNRYWKHFFGHGLVEPEDDLRETNPASIPELLSELRAHFIDSDFDLKNLVRLITTSRTYQSAGPIIKNAFDKQNFSHASPRRLSAEVLLDAIDRVCETTTSFANLPTGTVAVALPDSSYTTSSSFLRVFGRPANTSACECERSQTASLAQSLYLMNADDLKKKIAATTGRAHRYADETRPHSQQIHELYRAALSREPTVDELFVAEHFVHQHSDNLLSAYEDLIWALLNSKEFLFNH